MENFSKNKNDFLKVALSALLLFCLASCSKTKDVTVVKFSSWGSESEISILKPILREFEGKNPKVKVELIHIPKNYFQKLHLLIASDLAPDVMFLNNFNGPVFAENKVFENLSPYIQNDGSISEKDFFEKSLTAFRYKEQLYAIPRDISNLVVYYNKDLFDRYNVAYPAENWSFNDFLKTAKSLTKDFNNDGKPELYGTSFEEMSLFWMPYLWSNGGGIISSDLKSVIVNKPESIEALQFYADLRNRWHVAPTASEQGSATTAQMFMQGKMAMEISGRWSVPRFRQEIEFNWDICKFPSGKAGSIVDADASGWAMSSRSNHKKESWALISFLASKNASEDFTQSGLIIPARIDVAKSEVFLRNDQNPESSQIFVDVIDKSIPTPANENYQEIIDLINADLEPLWNGQKLAKEVVTDDLINDIQRLLK